MSAPDLPRPVSLMRVWDDGRALHVRQVCDLAMSHACDIVGRACTNPDLKHTLHVRFSDGSLAIYRPKPRPSATTGAAA